MKEYCHVCRENVVSWGIIVESDPVVVLALCGKHADLLSKSIIVGRKDRIETLHRNMLVHRITEKLEALSIPLLRQILEDIPPQEQRSRRK